MKIKAKFKGADGSCGYRNGQNYTLDFKTTDDNAKQGSDHLVQIYKINTDCPCIGTNIVLYESLRSFLNNWQILK